MTRKNNKVAPLRYHENSNQSASPEFKSDEKRANLGKGSWNKITNFFSQLVCTERKGVEVFHSHEKVLSMYGELSDTDNQTPPPSPLTKPKQRQHRPEFKEVVFTLSKEEITNSRDAKVTVPTSDLPKPNECLNAKEQRTNAEILQELSVNGLVDDTQPSVTLDSVKPGGVSFEIRMTTVRPRTAKGQRVPRPPRRLESLKMDAVHMRERTVEEISAKIKSKQEKASLKRQVLQETRQQKRRDKSQKTKQTIDSIAEAAEKKKEALVGKMAEKEERAETIRQEQQEERSHSQDVTNCRIEHAKKSEELSQGCSMEVLPDEDLDRISTYNGSDESDDDGTDYLKSIKGDDKYDAFYDGPNQGTFMF